MGAQEELGIGRNQGFRQRRRLDQKKPPEIPRRELPVGGPVHGRGRRDIEDGDALHGIGMVERQPMGHARAAVVSYDAEPVMAERPHQRHLVSGHGAFRVVAVLIAAGRTRGVTIAAQVRGDDGKTRGNQLRSDRIPGGVGLRMAVQKQHGGSASGLRAMDPHTGLDLDVERGETRQEFGVGHEFKAGVGRRQASGRPPHTAVTAVAAGLTRREGGAAATGTSPALAADQRMERAAHRCKGARPTTVRRALPPKGPASATANSASKPPRRHQCRRHSVESRQWRPGRAAGCHDAWRRSRTAAGTDRRG